ncbi:MAG: hypothetical protein KGY78_11935 [Anaerolineae bacterium]|nr:hypothetical protein [Anaerolineae bacterium]
MVTRAILILIGAALLLVGRQLYWLFVAGVGFSVAIDLVTRLTEIQSPLLLLAIALAAGLAGALLAVLLQRLAVAIAGFLAGGYVVMALLDLVELQAPTLAWVLALVGAILGVVLTLALFEWALIILSSLSGAGVIIQTLDLSRGATIAAFLILLVIGIAVQASQLGREEPAERIETGT